MAKIGVSWILRKAGKAASSTTEITQEGSDWRIATTSTVKSSNELFTPGVEKDLTTMDGRKVKVNIVTNFFQGPKWERPLTATRF